ncbi:substrate-binding domain-containing protein [Ruminococcus sp.]|uniref:PstS family phosphate ABC transporter substrate-binding protein n=1 Tax=Ruminococcus sp. TaxID=41978 RepID=UPI0025D715A9|nr:substrate-binding domain-containing protein [Ruminococcus sp.]
MGNRRKTAAILMLIGIFAGFDAAIYSLFTKRCIDTTSKEMQQYSVELHRYMPFDENSDAVKVDSDLKFTDKLPVLDGAAALYPVFSGIVNSVYPEGSINFKKGGFTSESALHFTNTKGAYKAVVDGDADIIFCARPSESQLKYAEENGTELEFVDIGWEAFVFIVNKENPVDGLTTHQVRDIFSGKITNWSEVGGENLPIEALSRNEGSGSQTTMDKFMGGTKQKCSPFGTFGRSIGYSFRYYVDNMVGCDGVKKLELDGISPNKEHIADGSYPLASTFCAVYRKDNTNPHVKELTDWVLSEKGQEIIEKAGYVPLG